MRKRSRWWLLATLCAVAVSWGVVPAAYGCGYYWFGDTWLNWVSQPGMRDTYNEAETLQQMEASPASYNYGCVNAYISGYGELWGSDICARVGYVAIGTAGSAFYGQAKTFNYNFNTQRIWGWEYEDDILC